MENPRPEKVAVVDEVKARFADSDSALLTEYRGLTVADLAQLRTALSAAGGDYKVYKNTLVRLAVADTAQAGISELLTGPTAIAFVSGDVSAVAKALKDFSRANPLLVIKGGVVGEGTVTAGEVNALADLPSRDVLLAQFAGALAAPMRQLAGLLQALPRNLAYGLAALVDQRRASGETAEPPAEPAPEAPTETPDVVAEVAPESDQAEAAPADAASAEAAPADAAPESESESESDTSEADTAD